MNSSNLFLVSKEDNSLILKNYIGNSKFNFNPLNKPLLLGFRNYLAIINPHFYSLYLRKAFLFIFYSSQKFAKGFFIYDNNSYKHLNKYILDIKHFSSSIFKFGFLSNFKKVMKDLNFKYEGQDKYNFSPLEFPDYVFLFEENFSYSYIFNECNKTELPMVSIMNSDTAITFSSYGIISNNTGFQTSTYYTLFFIKVIKQALNLKKYDFYNNKLKVFYKNSFHFLLNLKFNSLATNLDSVLSQPLSLILNYVTKNSIKEVYFSEQQEFIKKLLLIKRKRIRQLKVNLSNYLSDYNNEFYNYLKDFEYTKFFNKQFPKLPVTTKTVFETLFSQYVEDDKKRFAEIKEFVTFIVEVKNYNDFVKLKMNNVSKFETFFKLLKYMNAFMKKHKTLPFLNALINRKNRFNIFYFNKIARKLQYYYKRQLKKDKKLILFRKYAKLYKKYNLFDEKKYNFMNKNNFYYFNKFNLDSFSRDDVDKIVTNEAKLYKRFGIKKRFYLDKLYKDLKFEYYTKASKYHRKIDHKKLTALLKKLSQLYLTDKKKILSSVYKKLKYSIVTNSSIYLTKEERKFDSLTYVKGVKLNKPVYFNRAIIPPYRVKKNYQILKRALFLSFLKKKLSKRKILDKVPLYKKLVPAVGSFKDLTIQKLANSKLVSELPDSVKVSFLPKLSEIEKNPNAAFFSFPLLKKKRKLSKYVKPTQFHIGRINFEDPYAKNRLVYIEPDLTALRPKLNLFSYSPSFYTYLVNSLFKLNNRKNLTKFNLKRFKKFSFKPVIPNFYKKKFNQFSLQKLSEKQVLASLVKKVWRKEKSLDLSKKRLLISSTLSSKLFKKSTRLIKHFEPLTGMNNKQKFEQIKKKLIFASSILNKKERKLFVLKIYRLIKLLTNPSEFNFKTFLIKLNLIDRTKIRSRNLRRFIKRNFGFNIQKLPTYERKLTLKYVKTYFRSTRLVNFCNKFLAPYVQKVKFLKDVSTPYKFVPEKKQEQTENLTSFADKLTANYNSNNSKSEQKPKQYVKRLNPNYIHYPTPEVIEQIIKKPEPVDNKAHKVLNEKTRVINVEDNQLNPFVQNYVSYLKNFIPINKYRFDVTKNTAKNLKLSTLIQLINFSLAKLTKFRFGKIISFNFILNYLVKNNFITTERFKFYKKYYFNFVTKGVKRYFVNSFKFLFNDFIVRNFFNFDLSFKKIKKIYKSYYFLKPKINQFKKNYVKVYRHFLKKLKHEIKLLKDKKSFYDNVEEATKTGKVLNGSFSPKRSNLTTMAEFNKLILNNTEGNFSQSVKESKVSNYVNHYYKFKIAALLRYKKRYKFNRLNKFYYNKNYFYSTFISPVTKTALKQRTQLKKKINTLKSTLFVSSQEPKTVFKSNLIFNKNYGQRQYGTIWTHSGHYPTVHDKEEDKDPHYYHKDLINETESEILFLNKVINLNRVDKLKVKDKLSEYVKNKLQKNKALPININKAVAEAKSQPKLKQLKHNLNFKDKVLKKYGGFFENNSLFNAIRNNKFVEVDGKVINLSSYSIKTRNLILEKVKDQLLINILLKLQFERVKNKTKDVITKVRELKPTSITKFDLFRKINKEIFNSKFDLINLNLANLNRYKLHNESNLKRQLKHQLISKLLTKPNQTYTYKLSNYSYFKDFKSSVYYLNFKRKSDLVALKLANNVIKSKIKIIKSSYGEIARLYTNYFKIFNTKLLPNYTTKPLFFNINLVQPNSLTQQHNIATHLPLLMTNFKQIKLQKLTKVIISYITNVLISKNCSNLNLGAESFLFVDDVEAEFQNLFKKLTTSTYLSTLTAYSNKNLKSKLNFLKLSVTDKFNKIVSLSNKKFKSLTKLKFRYSYRKLKYKRYKKFKPTLFGTFHFVKNKYRRRKFKYNLIRKKKVPNKIYRY